MSRFRGREIQRFREGGDFAAAQLLRLIESDTGTALIWDYAKTDRRFADPTGGANPAMSGDVVGLDLDSSKWGAKTFGEVLAEQTNVVTANNTNPTTLDGLSGLGITNGVVTTVAKADLPPDVLAALVAAGIADQVQRVFKVQTTATLAGNLAFMAPVAANVTCVWEAHVMSIGGSVTLDFTNSGAAQVIPADGAFARRYTIAAVPSGVQPRLVIPTNRTVYFILQRLRVIPSNPARQGTGAAKPKWQPGPKPFLQMDGIDDFAEITGNIPNSAGTVVVAARPLVASNMYFLAGGGASGDRRVRLGTTSLGMAEFTHGANFVSDINGGAQVNIVDQDVVMVMTWGNGRRRFYFNGLPNPLVRDEAVVINMDGTTQTYKIGSLDNGLANYANARIYGTLVRSVETSDADIRNIILPAFKGLYQ